MTETPLGDVFTAPWVVELLLDWAGYTSDADLGRHRAIEPAAGHGAFAVPMVERLLHSATKHGRHPRDLVGAVRFYDIDGAAIVDLRNRIRRVLLDTRVHHRTADMLLKSWILHCDFLQAEHDAASARWVIGNPPYVRAARIKPTTMSRYRALWETMTGRSDLYVGFLEAGLRLLEDGGTMGTICADRWMHNEYGRPLRRLVSESFSVDGVMVLHRTDAFEEKVSAYPAITVIRRGQQGDVFVCDAEAGFGQDDVKRVLDEISGPQTQPSSSTSNFTSSWVQTWPHHAESWPSGDPHTLELVAHAEANLPTIESTGVTIGVGIATGADAVFIPHRRPENVEPGRLVKVVAGRDLSTGRVEWAERWLVNPWENDTLVVLSDYPGLAAYLRRHKPRLSERYIAKRNPHVWWRTIDRVNQDLIDEPKLLLPDLKDRVLPVLDDQGYYPSHSVYWIRSSTWDLEVLGGILLSDPVNAIVRAYSVQMANGFMRVSAQYLRRIRVPHPTQVSDQSAHLLREAFRSQDRDAATRAVEAWYGI